MPRNQIVDDAWRDTLLSFWDRIFFELCATWANGYGRERQGISGYKTEAPHLVGSRPMAIEIPHPLGNEPGANLPSPDNSDFRVGGNRKLYLAAPNEYPSNHVNKAHGIDTASAFLSSLADGAQAVYRRAWKRWVSFCK